MTAPIKTERLELRVLVPEDAGWMAREIARPEVHRWLTRPPYPYRLEDAERFIQDHARPDPGHRAIWQDQAPLGVVSLSVRDDGPPILGYWLRQDAWGQGVMSEAVRGLLDWYATNGGGPVASGWIDGNERSQRLLERLGFRPNADHMEHSPFLGQEVLVKSVILDQWGPLVTARSDRLILDALSDSDLDVVHREWGAPDIARMVSSVTPNWSRDEARHWLTTRLAQSERGFGCAIRLTDGTLVGSVGLGGDPRRLGYMIGRTYWGNGFATEAVGAFVAAAFDRLADLPAIEAQVFDDNPGSAAVLEKLGFRRISSTDCTSKGRVEKDAASLYRVTRSELKAGK